jgi:hypothetical protein
MKILNYLSETEKFTGPNKVLLVLGWTTSVNHKIVNMMILHYLVMGGTIVAIYFSIFYRLPVGESDKNKIL